MATSNDPKWNMQRALYESFTSRTGRKYPQNRFHIIFVHRLFTYTSFEGAQSIVMAVNKTDWSFGWHGHRAGLAVYYFDDVVMQNDHHELSLTSGLTLHAQLMITKNKLLGSPYTKCLPKTKASECYRKTTEASFLPLYHRIAYHYN